MRSIFLIFAMILFAATVAIARDNTLPPAENSDPHIVEKVIDSIETGGTVPTVDNSHRQAMHDELLASREQIYNQVMALSARITASNSSEERMELQRQVIQLKDSGTLQSMSIQLKYARLGGFAELEEQLETNIELFQARRDAPRRVIGNSGKRSNSARGGQTR